MKILITTGLSEQDIGGPFQYAFRLKEALEQLGHSVKLVVYGRMEKLLPVGLRHLYLFLKILPNCFWVESVLTLDTFSTGVPTVSAAKFCGKKVIVRVGGDSLWSAYVNRTSEPVKLGEFYRQLPALNFKERLVHRYMSRMIKQADFLTFNTEWQRKIWADYYKIAKSKSGVLRNFIPPKREGHFPKKKNFLWAGRVIPEKNLKLLKKVGERVSQKHPEFQLDLISGESHGKVLERIKDCYAVVSMSWADFCPNFILEAVSYGKPFVMSEETGMSELYPRGGLFVDPLDEEAIERALETLLDEEQYQKRAEELKSLNLSHSWDEMAKEYLDIWNKI